LATPAAFAASTFATTFLARGASGRARRPTVPAVFALARPALATVARAVWAFPPAVAAVPVVRR
jgi:hypothetical protein